MKNILIIEDDENKIKQVMNFLQSTYENMLITVRKSYRSGVSELFEREFDCILLDMSLPNFDLSPGKSGGRYRSYAGVDILEEMKRNEIMTKTIVVTQYDVFGDGENRSNLQELKDMLQSGYNESYIGTVYYNATQYNWKDELKELLDDILF